LYAVHIIPNPRPKRRGNVHLFVSWRFCDDITKYISTCVGGRHFLRGILLFLVGSFSQEMPHYEHGDDGSDRHANYDQHLCEHGLSILSETILLLFAETILNG
jgi:hypothetical protein